MKKFLLILITLKSSTFFIFAAEKKIEQSPKLEQKSPHEKLLTKLRKSDDVIAPLNEIHPVRAQFNRESVIPPQCYTKNHETFNACYVCHQTSISGRENTMNDGDLQADYSFSDVGMTNQWKNLFEDRTERIAKISNEEIIAWVNQDNYSELPERLKKANFKGWIPELKDLEKGADAFDEYGFAKDGSHWVAFNYKPFPSTFWPTNGSTDDVMIRLGEEFRQDSNRQDSLDVYRANLAILEANIKGLTEITCLPVDENNVGKDLNGDDKLDSIEKITVLDSWVGVAEKIYKTSYIYPAKTEFLHTVRYLGFDKNQQITVSKRMKEVRYMKKWKAYAKPAYDRTYTIESFDKEAGNLPGYRRLSDHGLDSKFGWSVSGFIEGSKGRLRTLTHEENFSCMSCHSFVGSNIDNTFSFPRKVEGAKGWGYINLKDMPDVPNIGETKGEFETYLRRVGGGSEFRHNDEMTKKWFQTDNPTEVDLEKLQSAKDIYDLITPSKERALRLNKAYRTIVEDQDFIYGKDAIVTPPENVFEHIDNKSATTLPADKQYQWNILLDWSSMKQPIKIK